MNSSLDEFLDDPYWAYVLMPSCMQTETACSRKPEPTDRELHEQAFRAEIKRDLGDRIAPSMLMLVGAEEGEIYEGLVIAVSEKFIAQLTQVDYLVFVHCRSDLDLTDGPVEEGDTITVSYGQRVFDLIHQVKYQFTGRLILG